MLTYTILLLVLVGSIMVAAAFLDRRRGREIQHALAEHRRRSDDHPRRG